MTPERILRRDVEYACPWLEVVAKLVRLDPPRGEETFYSIRTASDYVAVLAVTEDGRVPLVRQFRPAIEDSPLELPSGAIDPGEDPEEAIRRELLEETGCEAGELVTLGVMYTDSGRMETRQWGFFAPRARAGAARPDRHEALELTFATTAEVPRLVLAGELRMAPHVAIVCLAVLGGHLQP